MDERGNKLLEYRMDRVEESQALLAESLGTISEAIISMKAWGKAAMFMFGLVHPILVGVIIRQLT